MEPARGHEQLTVAELVLAFWRHAQTYYRGSDGRPTTEVSNLKPVRTRAAAAGIPCSAPTLSTWRIVGCPRLGGQKLRMTRRELDAIKAAKVLPETFENGEDLLNILDLENGTAIYGLFVLFVAACSKQTSPRQGWLTADGTPDGRPWQARTLARRFRQPVDLVERALHVLASDAVGWLRVHPRYPHVLRWARRRALKVRATRQVQRRIGRHADGNAAATATEPQEGSDPAQHTAMPWHGVAESRFCSMAICVTSAGR